MTKYRHVGCEHLDSITNSHCDDPAGKCIHPCFTSISQYQSQVWTVYSDDEAWHTSASSDIHDCPGDAYKGVNKLARMSNDIRNWQCAESTETLRCSEDVFKTAGFWHVTNVVPNMQKARHTAGPSQ
jgi:hypothetical protein